MRRSRTLVKLLAYEDQGFVQKDISKYALFKSRVFSPTRILLKPDESAFWKKISSMVTMYRDTLNYNIYKVQQTQSTEECQPIPCSPVLS
ncbi:hypothetical protein B9Z55_025669 [Caenorhabditis nigoni]|uniref:Uncharacterized protein n=1 Tax=Caenorhabditis nigoni TaxID=1611254 RepID=A0A2G5SZT3_9PELO|nr:hypothetical protein B9Z55_025669 [Caenorhabditis nigoni]